MATLVKNGSLYFTFFPMNYYIKYIGKPTYKQGRNMGLNTYFSLWFVPFFYSLLLSMDNIIHFDFYNVILCIILNNTILSGVLYIHHKIKENRRKVISYNKLLIKNSIAKVNSIKLRYGDKLDDYPHIKENIISIEHHIAKLIDINSKL